MEKDSNLNLSTLYILTTYLLILSLDGGYRKPPSNTAANNIVSFVDHHTFTLGFRILD